MTRRFSRLIAVSITILTFACLHSQASEVGVSSKNHHSSTNSKNTRAQDVDCGNHLEGSGLDKILAKSGSGYSINRTSPDLRSFSVAMSTPELTGYEVDFLSTSNIRWHGHLAIDHKGTIKHFIVKFPNRDIAAQCPRPKDFNEIGRHWRGSLADCKKEYTQDHRLADVIASAQTMWCQEKSLHLSDCKARFNKDKDFAEDVGASSNAWCRIRGYGD